MPRFSSINWRTSLAGIAMILTSGIGILQHFNDGTPIDIGQHVTEIIGGIGLIMAQDAPVWKGRDSLTDSERGSGHGKDI